MISINKINDSRNNFDESSINKLCHDEIKVRFLPYGSCVGAMVGLEVGDRVGDWLVMVMMLVAMAFGNPAEKNGER